jgi:hypothetical protein
MSDADLNLINYIYKSQYCKFAVGAVQVVDLRLDILKTAAASKDFMCFYFRRWR